MGSDRLLTDEETRALSFPLDPYRGSEYICRGFAEDCCKIIKEAQDTKTASIVIAQAKKEERERIFSGIERIAKSCPEEPIGKLPNSLVYQALKQT